MSHLIDSQRVRAISEAAVRQHGGQVCDGLPCIESTPVRTQDAVIARALILNAMLNIHFGAPTALIRAWIAKHGLTDQLSRVEAGLLARHESELTTQELIHLYWYIEALWAFLWATRRVATMDFTTPIPDSMASLCPDFHHAEGPEKFTTQMALRDEAQLYQERDLYYRVMWWSRQISMTDQDDPKFDLSRTLERRRALEWIADQRLDWDEVPLST